MGSLYSLLLGLFLGPLFFSIALTKELRAEAELIDQKGERIGKANFIETSNGVLIMLEASGLPTNAELALHIHEIGRCDPPDFTSAKGHFNPYKKSMAY